MKNFLKVADGIDTMPLKIMLQCHSELWDENTLRTTHPDTPHAQVSDIWLRFNDLTLCQTASDVLDQHESINYPAFKVLAAARPLVFQLMARVEGERLGRVLITKLAPGGRITPHVDSGDHAEYYERFHVVLQASPGCIFRAGDEQVQMKTGECWWFQNKEMHEVINNSAEDRIHLIVDIKVSR